MSRPECGIIGLCPMLKKDSKIKDCDECEKTQFNGVEEVFGVHTDTAGNFHWIGTKTGHHKVR